MIAGFLAFSMLATAPESTSAAKVEQGGTKSETNITEYRSRQWSGNRRSCQ